MKAENVVTWSRALVEGGDVQLAEVRTPALGHFLDRRLTPTSTVPELLVLVPYTQGEVWVGKVPYLQRKL